MGAAYGLESPMIELMAILRGVVDGTAAGLREVSKGTVAALSEMSERVDENVMAEPGTDYDTRWRNLFACEAMLGIQVGYAVRCAKADAIFSTAGDVPPDTIAKTSFDLGEAMLAESHRRVAASIARMEAGGDDDAVGD